MGRVPDLDPTAMSDRQREVHDQIAATRAGAVRGPFAIWLRDPELADAADRLGSRLRSGGAAGRRRTELMILVVARHWSAQYAWFVHEAQARSVGLDEHVVEAIRTGRVPAFDRPDEAVVHAVVSELLTTRDLGEDTYRRGVTVLGLDALIDLITACGFYSMVAMVLKGFDAPVPGDARPLP